MMDIVHKNDRWEPAVGEYKNCIVLYNDHWNDYCYMTTFHAVYCDKHGKCANYAQTECQFRYCGTAIPFLTVRSTAR